MQKVQLAEDKTSIEWISSPSADVYNIETLIDQVLYRYQLAKNELGCCRGIRQAQAGGG